MTELELPTGWAYAAIEDVADLNPKSFCVVPHAIDAMAHFIPMAAVAEEFAGVDVSERRPIAEVQKGYTSCTAYDVLFAKITPCMENGKGCVVPSLPDHVAFGSTEFHVLRSTEAVTSNWLANYLSQKAFRKEARSNMTGSAGQLRVPSNWLRSIRIPVAPLNEQVRVNAKVAELLSGIDDGVAELEAARTKLRQYQQSLLQAAVQGNLTAEWRAQNLPVQTGSKLLQCILTERRARWEDTQRAKALASSTPLRVGWQTKYPEPAAPIVGDLPRLPCGWVWASIDQLSQLITSGSRGWAEFYSDTGAMFIRSQDINQDRLELSEIARVTPPAKAEGNRTRVKKDDLLITITGANVGRTARVETELDEAYVSQHVGLIRLVVPALATYVHLCLIANAAGRGHLLAEAYGAGKPGLNLGQVSRACIPLPGLQEAEALVQILMQHFAAVDHLSAALKRQFGLANAQRQNILHAAFAGELVPQDPADEPADALLARIQASRIGVKPPVRRQRAAATSVAAS